VYGRKAGKGDAEKAAGLALGFLGIYEWEQFGKEGVEAALVIRLSFKEALCRPGGVIPAPVFFQYKEHIKAVALTKGAFVGEKTAVQDEKRFICAFWRPQCLKLQSLHTNSVGTKKAIVKRPALFAPTLSTKGAQKAYNSGMLTSITQFLDSYPMVAVTLRVGLAIGLTLAIAWAFRAIGQKRMSGSIHARFAFSVGQMFIYFVGFIEALSQIRGFNSAVQATVAGSGIIAIVVGLAAQEALGNIFNGMFISVFKPFEVNDRIHLVNADITGTVEDITLRHTIVRTFLNSRLIIPNSTINKDIIENSHFADKKSSGFVDVAISYRADLDRALEIMGKVAYSHPEAIYPDGPPKAYVRGFTLYGVELRVSVTAADINKSFNACSDIRKELKNCFDAEGIPMASIESEQSVLRESAREYIANHPEGYVSTPVSDGGEEI